MSHLIDDFKIKPKLKGSMADERIAMQQGLIGVRFAYTTKI